LAVKLVHSIIYLDGVELLSFGLAEVWNGWRSGGFEKYPLLPYYVCRPATLDLVLVPSSTCSVEPYTGLLRDPGGYTCF